MFNKLKKIYKILFNKSKRQLVDVVIDSWRVKYVDLGYSVDKPIVYHVYLEEDGSYSIQCDGYKPQEHPTYVRLVKSYLIGKQK